MKLRVALGADHGGFELKQELVRRLSGNVEILDKGSHAYDAHDDYPDYVEAVGRAVASGQADRGVLICGSGVGATVAANKIAGVRACVCHDTYSAHQGVEHDDLNVLCLGARVVGVEVATELAIAFLMARFSGEARHVRRLEKVKALEAKLLTGAGGERGAGEDDAEEREAGDGHEEDGAEDDVDEEDETDEADDEDFEDIEEDVDEEDVEEEDEEGKGKAEEDNAAGPDGEDNRR